MVLTALFKFPDTSGSCPQFAKYGIRIVIRKNIGHTDDLSIEFVSAISPFIRFIHWSYSPFTEIGKGYDITDICSLIPVIGNPYFKTGDMKKAVDLRQIF